MIPANIDHVAIIEDLNRWGLKDAKIELVCDFSQGYVQAVKKGRVQQMLYQRAARLYNFWLDEMKHRVPVESVQQLAATS